MESRESLKAHLEAELGMLVRRRERLEDHLHNKSRELPQDWDDRATMMEDDEVVEALDERTHVRIAELRHALARLDDPEWGLCESCGEAIALRRLAALPAAQLCVRCAEAFERT